MDERKNNIGIQCKDCEEILFSMHVHDFVTCRCGKVSIDGGSEYLRFLFEDKMPNRVVIQKSGQIKIEEFKCK